MDFGGVVFSIFFTGIIGIFWYGMARNLKEYRRKVLEREGGFRVESLERKAEKLRETIEALERSPDERHEVEARAERLDQTRGQYARRLENLEAVVMSHAWDGADDSEPGARPPEKPEVAVRDLNRQRTAELARQLDK